MKIYRGKIIMPSMTHGRAVVLLETFALKRDNVSKVLEKYMFDHVYAKEEIIKNIFNELKFLDLSVFRVTDHEVWYLEIVKIEVK